MPQAIAGAVLVPLVNAFGFAVGGALAIGVGYLGTAALLYGGSLLISNIIAGNRQGTSPEAPKPEDGKFNLKQNVPPLTYVLGRVKKGGDYALLEEAGGTAYHIIVDAAHSIEGYQEHWLHDEPVTLDGNGWVTAPAHFGTQNVRIKTRDGADASTAYAEVVSAFPSIWTNDHRGDGLATAMMMVKSVASESFQATYPQGMPVRTSVIQGNDRIFDPREETHDPDDESTWSYSTNIALFRLWHLTHPVGGKLTLDDIHLPDWAAAADVCDELVTNRDGGTEPRYHGGVWFRANNDPVQIGRLLDQAADLVIYERPDGKVGVHAGEFAAPDVRLTADDIIACTYDANKRAASDILAVRGRYTNPDNGFNSTDAAIFGNPYVDETERTKTVENQVVQSHNHMQRLQKLAYLRSVAPRVRIVAHYEAARQVAYRRFVTVHYPPKLDEAVIEIIGRPTLSLRSLTYEFEGLVVSPTLYDFDALTEEGEPPAVADPIERGEVPEPDVASITLKTEVVAGGATAAYFEFVFNLQNAAFQYQIEWQPTAGGAIQSFTGAAGELTLRTGYLADGVQYRVRSRTWSAGVPSDWTAYTNITATADAVAPGIATGVSATGGSGQITFNWTAPNSANYVGARLYWNTSNTMTGATLAATEFGPPNIADSRVVTGISAGTRYGFVVAINGSGVAAAAVATGAIIVT